MTTSNVKARDPKEKPVPLNKSNMHSVWVQVQNKYQRGYHAPDSLLVYSDPVMTSTSLLGTFSPTTMWPCNTEDRVTQASDLTRLVYLDEANLLYALESRYCRDQIYSDMAGVLLAVNPYKTVNVDNQTQPHIFRMAQKALSRLQATRQNQSLLCCGESGSGKTVSTRMLMQQLCGVSTLSTAVNSVLESFGNAQTRMNHNSSRFAKFLKLGIDVNTGTVLGIHTETYLLERSRVVSIPPQERTFHVFYQLCSQSHTDYYPGPASSFNYLARTTVTKTDASAYHALVQYLKELKFYDIEIQSIFKILAAILHLGNIVHKDPAAASTDLFEPDAQSLTHITKTAHLLGLSVESLKQRLCTRHLQAGNNDTVVKVLSVHEAYINRDSMAKTLYHDVFGWIVKHINQTLATTTSEHWIGILDLFGFECFETNSFEQFCINFANESLQNLFNQQILRSEQEEYRKEGILWTPVAVQDNTDTLTLLRGRPSGMFSLLDSACIMPKGTASVFVDNIYSTHRGHIRLQKKPTLSRHSFGIQHYASVVIYDAEKFLMKNADATHPDTVLLFSTSSNPLISEIWTAPTAVTWTFKRFESLGRQFVTQLDNLRTTLEATHCGFIRCINPNPSQRAQVFDWQYIRPQIRNGGLLEAVRMLKYGYPLRVPYLQLIQALGPQLVTLLHQPLEVLQDPAYPFLRNTCEALVRSRGVTAGYQWGWQKAFFTSEQTELVNWLYTISRKPLTPELSQDIYQWIKRRRWHRVRAALRFVVKCQRRVSMIRTCYMLRRTVRTVVMYQRTLKRCLLRVRHRLQIPALPELEWSPPLPEIPDPLKTAIQTLQLETEKWKVETSSLRTEQDVLVQKMSLAAQERDAALEDQSRLLNELHQTTNNLAEMKILYETKEQRLLHSAEEESRLVQSLACKDQELLLAEKRLAEIEFKQETLMHMIAQREQEYAAQAQDLKLHAERSQHFETLLKSKEEELEVYGEYKHTDEAYQSQLHGAQQVLSDLQASVKAKDQTITHLQQQITEMRQDMTARIKASHRDMQEELAQIRREHEERVRQLKKTIRRQQTQIMRLTESTTNDS